MTRRKVSRRSQPRLKTGPRDPLPSSVAGPIWQAVERDATHYGVSRSWVTAKILARHYRITIPEY